MPGMTLRGVRRLRSVCVFLLFIAARASAADSLSDLTGPWQLLIDDFIVDAKSGLTRSYHAFEKHTGNPVLEADPDKCPWEVPNTYLYGTVLPTEDHTGYRMWYHVYSTAEGRTRSCYATSPDGVQWTKPPNLGIVTYNGSTANNIYTSIGSLVSVMHTPFNADPNRRYTFFAYGGGGFVGAWSPDATHWTKVSTKPLITGPDIGDVGHAAWDPFRERYIAYVKMPGYPDGLRCRSVAFSETTDFTSWPAPYLIMTPDAIDNRWVQAGTIQRTHFYGFCPFAYESQYIGFLWIFRATDGSGYNDGTIYAEVVSSRDAIHWTREEGDRPPLLPLGPPGAWDDSMVFTSTHPLKEGDTLRLYYGGFNDTHAQTQNWQAKIGLATLRKDGFASLDAGPTEGMVTTRKLAGTSGPLHVNYHATGGCLKAEVLDENSLTIPGYGRDDCTALQDDSVDQVVTWTGGQGLPTSSSPIRLRFILQGASLDQKASLYSFNAGPVINVVDPLTIPGQPVDCKTLPGSTATFTVQPNGMGPLTYQWQREGTDLVDDGRVTGATTATLNLTRASAADAGRYRCAVESPFGSAISNEALLTVNPPGDFDLDGDVDLEDFGHFQACLSGKYVPQDDPACQGARLDADNDVDQADLILFLRCMTAPGIPAGSDCAN